MASPFQQQAFQRKVIYLLSVVLLLLGSWLWRENVVKAQARDLALLEESRGEVQLVDSAIRLGLSGSRGLVTCALWVSAIEKQKKNQWNELELIVGSLTKLQPHFITPWLFQSWNLAYNVSVESDRVRDKYFYITRGIQLLANGERQNNNNPELRREIGFYHQHKICQSDENNTHRSLFQLSCIPPVERDPDRFRKPNGEVNWDELKQFCKNHPQLARRLHSPPLPYNLRREYRKFRCATAEDVIQFLEDNATIPSLFVEREQSEEDWGNAAQKDIKDLRRFPVLPPERANSFDPEEWTQEKVKRNGVPDSFDAYHVSRAWYSYSQEPLPPPDELPGSTAPIKDRLRERIPRHMSTIIFRSSPPRAQTYVAERLQEEGWYDNEPFTITGWNLSDPLAGDQPFQVGEGREAWSRVAWERAHRAWLEFGLRNHLWFEDPAFEKEKKELAERFREEHQLSPGAMPQLNEELLSEQGKRGLEAARFMFELNFAVARTNFNHFRLRSSVESQEKTVIARKQIYQAEQFRLVGIAGEPAQLEALEKYERPDALQAWREVLQAEENKDFRNDEFIQEWTFDIELKYLRLYRSIHRTSLTRNLALQTFLGQAVAPAPLGADWALLGMYSRPQLLMSEAGQYQPKQLTILGPFDKDDKGKDFIPEHVKDQVLIRRDLKKPSSPTPVRSPSDLE